MKKMTACTYLTEQPQKAHAIHFRCMILVEGRDGISA